MHLLETKDLGIVFGGLQALNDLHLAVDAKEIVGLIGPNGAGKTTVFNLLTGVYAPPFGLKVRVSSARSRFRLIEPVLPEPSRIFGCSNT